MSVATTSKLKNLPKSAARTPAAHLPGELGMWGFILADMSVFALFFLFFLGYQGAEREVFLAGQQTLNVHIGAFNTIVLLFSSWFVALAVGLLRTQPAQRQRAANFIALAGLCGVLFGALKTFEYWQKIDAGLTLTTDHFYMYYYAFTGMHFVHVIVGVALLGVAWFHLRGTKPTSMLLVENTAIYWHMVDLLWIVLFPLIYLAR